MSVLFLLLFFAAMAGVLRPYINGLNRKHFGLAAFLSFILIGVFAPKAEESATQAASTTQIAPADKVSNETIDAETIASARETPPSKWEYSEDKDEMRGTTTKFASVTSENTVDLDFPYGVVNGTIWVRKRPEDGLNVMFSVDEGQILCSTFQDTHLSIKFDDGPVKQFECTDAKDGSNETAFITSSSRALASLKKAKRTVIEAEFYRQGRQQFVFETAGLEWK